MLGNFTYSNPTKLYFGESALNNLSKELTNYGKNVLLVYGFSSIKASGLYDQIIKILHDSNKNIIEDSGVMPNPTVAKLLEGCKIARENHIDLILAVGGGSVCDYAKALAASAHCDEDPWEKYYIKMAPVDNKIIPMGCILTMVGTGSEMNGGSVITDEATNLKICRGFGEQLFPKFSILNPVLTYTVPQKQMVAGIFDIMSHLLEQYFSGNDDNTTDYLIEGMLKSLIHSSKVAIKNPKDYEARSNIMWTATWALNTFLGKGKSGDWMVHMIGHAISAYTDATHGMTLAAVSMPYYRLIMPSGLDKFKRYAINVWGVESDSKSDEKIALEGLNRMETYIKELGLTLSIKDLDVTKEMLNDIVKATFILKSGYKTLTPEDIHQICLTSLTTT